jgi:MFS-type transporter involved in bile tolerance (Atg22 family)
MAEPLFNLALSIVARAALDKNGIDKDHLNLTTTNATLIGMQRKYCTLTSGCPIGWATIKYRPSIAGNVIYMLCFFVLFAAQLFYGIRKKTWTYMGALLVGIFAEAIGYVGRVMLNQNPYSMDNFLMYVPQTQSSHHTY